MLIKIYVYGKQNKVFLYEDSGHPDFVIEDLGNDKDFTLTPPPDNTKTWRWINDKWE